jgi:hypothetical protein
MKRVIWKFELKGFRCKIEMPKDASILEIQTQKETPCIWAICDPEAEKETRTFVVKGTGHVYNFMEEPLIYLGTFQEGRLVWHVFEVGE